METLKLGKRFYLPPTEGMFIFIKVIDEVNSLIINPIGKKQIIKSKKLFNAITVKY